MQPLTYKIYYSTAELPHDWDSFGEDIFLQIPYLVAQEKGSPANMDYFYVAFYSSNEIAAKLVVQRIKVKGKEIFRNSNQIKEDLLNILNLNLLCVGNIKLTGEHAWEIKPTYNQENLYALIPELLKEIKKISKKQQIPIKLLLIKDFYAEKTEILEPFFNDYEVLSVQPNMIFKPDNSWLNFEDYLAAMRTKYRTRAKRAFNKAAGITFRELELAEIASTQDKLYELYQNVLNSNSFSLYKLPDNFFVEMKSELSSEFTLYGGFLNGQLVCFYSIIENGKQLEAGFLGYDATLQHDKQLYLNMLYKMISFTIDNGFESIDFSRTAMEIKSSVGAEPYEMFGFLKHTNPVMNRLVKATFRKFYQPEEWIPRNPFRE